MYPVQESAGLGFMGWSIIGGILTFIWFVFLYPIWKVWASQKEGEAALQNAEKEQQIQVSKAKGRLDAAELNKKAAIVEAEAVSAQIEKIGKQLNTHDLYLKWQWIKMMEERPEASTIYIPTEANMPILEATRRSKPIIL